MIAPMGPIAIGIEKLTLRSYKSVAAAEVDFAPLTVFVGRNGVGKSNLIDALRFVGDALNSTLEYAIRERGGIDQVRRKSLAGRPPTFQIGVVVRTANSRAHYGFGIAAVQGGSFRVDRESCSVTSLDGTRIAHFSVQRGELVKWSPSVAGPAVSDDRLFLVSASGLPEFRPVYDVLTRMAFHNLNPDAMKYPVRPEPGERLTYDGHNLPSVIKRLETEAPERLDRVVAYLRALGVPISSVSHKHVGAFETIEVTQEVGAADHPKNLKLDAVALSDGTVRALGILVSLLSGRGEQGGPSVVGIEEPETALHPAAVGALVDALVEGAQSTQIVLTCHSPDLLDHASIEASMIRVVLTEEDRTVLGPLSPDKADLMQQHLASAGELLRLDQLTPDPHELQRQRQARGTLFEAAQE